MIEAERVAGAGAAQLDEPVEGGVHIVDLDGEMAQPQLVGSPLGGVVSDPVGGVVLPQLQVAVRSPHHHPVGRRPDQAHRTVGVGVGGSPPVPSDDLHVEQRPVEGDGGIEVTNHQPRVMDPPDAQDQAARRSRTWTRLPLGSRRYPARAPMRSS